MQTKYLEKGDPQVCNKVLRDLPKWFGIEEAIQEYIGQSSNLPMVIMYDENRPVGFCSLKFHSKFTAEIYVMGVLDQFQRRGIGKSLLETTEGLLRGQDIEFLQVKTLSEDREDEYYKKTRLFYKSSGFKEVEVFPTLWDKSNPCLLMIKSLLT